MIRIICTTLIFAIFSGLSKVIYIDPHSPNAVNDNSCWSGGKEKPCTTFDIGIEGLHNGTGYKQSGLYIAGGYNYTFSNGAIGNFYYVNNVIIASIHNESVNNTPSVSCSNGSGLSFVHSKNITISGMSFHHCNKAHNTTLINISGSSFIQTSAALYFLYCEDIRVTSVSIQDTTGKGMVLYNTAGSNSIENCSIRNNMHYDNSTHPYGGGGVYIEYSSCESSNISDNCTDSDNDSYIKNAEIIIFNSHFISNSAGSFWNSSISSYLRELASGGGISIYFKGNSGYNTIRIVDCTIENNTAVLGGGVCIEFQDYSVRNTVVIASSYVVQNNAYHEHFLFGGGGFRIGVRANTVENSDVFTNQVVVKGTIFKNNHAYYGGGLSYYNNAVFNQSLLKHDCENIILQLFKCHFENNQAVFGSAVDLTTKKSIPDCNAVEVQDCSFTSNSPLELGRLVGKGSLFIDATNIVFKGNGVFAHNKGSVIIASGSSVIVFCEFSNSSFSHNSGRYGACLSFLGSSYMIAEHFASLSFINNLAEYHGGAIYHHSDSEHEIFLWNCFIQFEEPIIPPDNWTATFEFFGNYAQGQANSIYSSTILSCVWSDGLITNEPKVQNVFCWNAHSLNWIYDGSGDEKSCNNHVSTAPSSFIIDGSEQYHAVPGQMSIALHLNVADDFGKQVTTSTTFIASIVSNNGLLLDNESLISNDNVHISGQENSTVSVRIETLQPIAIQSFIDINFGQCTPGFKFDNLSTICVCAGSFGGYVTCHEKELRASITRSTWIGQIDITSNEFVVGLCPYSVSHSNDSILIPVNVAMIDDVLCDNNRKGVLCGECKHGYGVSVNTNEYSCVRCTKSNVNVNWLLYLLSEFVPLTIFFIFVFLFSSIIALGPLNSFIFFAQMIYFVVAINAEGMIPIHRDIPSYSVLESIFIAIYEFWNLNFLRFILPGFCLGTSIKTLDVYALGYLTAVYPLFLLALFILLLFLYNRGTSYFVAVFRPLHRALARLRLLTGLHQSIPGGIAVFLLISYTKFAVISLDFFAYFPLYNAAGEVSEIVFYYDGSVLFPEEGLHYIIIAMFFICFFVIVPPILLAYPSLLLFLEKVSRNQLNLAKFYPNIKLQSFLDEFHGCYRNGSDGGIDCRWFSSFYFCLRVVLFTTSAQSNYWHTQYLVQLLTFLVVALMFGFIRPYRKDWINNLDTAIFINLAAIVAINQYQLHHVRFGSGTLDKAAFAFQFLLMIAPLFYAIGYVSSKMMRNTCKKCYRKHSRKQMEKEHDINNECKDEVCTTSAATTDYTEMKFLEELDHSAKQSEETKSYILCSTLNTN